MNSVQQGDVLEPAPSLREQVARIADAFESLSIALAHDQKSTSPSASPSEQLQRLYTSNNLEVQSSRLALIDACRTLLEDITGPEELFKFAIPISIQFNSAIAVIVHFNFATHVPEEGSISFDDLASKVNLHVERVRRVLRCVIAHNIFSEHQLGYISHNMASRVLLKPSLKAWLGHQTEEMLPASAKLVAAFEMYPDVQDDRETAFSVAFSGSKRSTYWEVLEKTPWKVKRFCDALEFITSSGGGADFGAQIGCYDWKKFGATKLVDVGGSTGRVSIAIANMADPGMMFVVQDLPELQEEALSTIPDSIQGRMTFEPHDFFDVQPVQDARVYMYRQILHDWPDGKAVEILKALVPALNRGDYLLLLESVQPDPKTLPNSVDRLIYAADLLMMAKHNSKERTLEMWKMLLKEADPRFVLENVFSPQDAGAQGAILEVRWSP